MKKLLFILIIIGIIIFLIWWFPYFYKDCLSVGHSKTYCIIKMF